MSEIHRKFEVHLKMLNVADRNRLLDRYGSFDGHMVKINKNGMERFNKHVEELIKSKYFNRIYAKKLKSEYFRSYKRY